MSSRTIYQRIYSKVKENIFNITGLKNAYKIALSAIALLATASCVILVKEIKHQENSSRIINISGRQRMLSQNIVKNLILVNTDFSANIKAESLKELSKNYYSWVKAHHALQHGDPSLDIPQQKLSPPVTNYFKEIEPHYKEIVQQCQKVLINENDENVLQTDLEKLLTNEKQFLILMDKITFQFDAEAKADVINLERNEIIFLIVTLITLMIEAMFIFKPIINLINREQRNSIKQIIIAEEAERKRIAADLHDSLLQLVVSLKMNLMNSDNTKLMEDKNNTHDTHLLNTLDLIADEIRTISYNLMPATLAEFGIAACIEQYILKVQYSTSAKIAFIQENKENIRIEPIKETLIYRVSQELLNNAIKHASASEIVIQLLFHKDAITLMVEDNGRGFDFDSTANATGTGLRNIKTRLQSIGAILIVDTTPQYGTTTTIQIPYTS